MAVAKPFIRIELDPLQPVQEICAVISAVLPYHPDREAEILQGVKVAIDERLAKKGGGANGDN